MTNTTYIYSLEFPEGNVRYIGKSNCPSDRLLSHIEEAKKFNKTYKNIWVRSLLKDDKTPFINIVDEVDKNDWQFWEQFYISLYKTYGFKLTNGTNGGEGLSNPSKEIRDKISKSLKGKKESKETKLKKSIALSGRKLSEIHKNNVSKSLKGHCVSEDQKLKQSSTMKEGYSNGDIKHWNKGTKGLVNAWNKGIEFSRERRLKDRRIKKVYQYSLDNKFIKCWECARDIEDSNIAPINGRMNIFSNCRGERRNAYGFIWKFKKTE